MFMRTTVTLEPEAASLVSIAMSTRQASFKEVVNQAIVQALSPQVSRPFHTVTARVGVHLPGDKALALVAALEDAEIVAKLERHK